MNFICGAGRYVKYLCGLQLSAGRFVLLCRLFSYHKLKNVPLSLDFFQFSLFY